MAANETQWLGLRDYEPVWREMQAFTDTRDDSTADKLWFCEHPSVFTLGMAASREHVLAPGDIPLVAIDRGGQVTYHGPGQLMIYPLVNVRRAKLGVRGLVSGLENAVIDYLASLDVEAASRCDAPGVYVDGKKIASIGLRIRRGCCYHGMAFNIDMDLEPFQRINPCGFSNLEVIDLRSLGITQRTETVAAALTPRLNQALQTEFSFPADMPKLSIG
ncbi:MAG: lipoyl(octanoyl) transferase LipB [Pseudomonadota bacterium]